MKRVTKVLFWSIVTHSKYSLAISLKTSIEMTFFKCNVQPSQATANPVDGKACSSTKGGLLRYTQHLLNSQSFEFLICILLPANMPLIRCTNVFYKGDYPVTLLPPPRRLAPSLGLGTTWVRQLRSGSCHHPTAATKCNVQPSQATANPVDGKACSSTKGGLLRYIPNTYSIHKVSSFQFAYYYPLISQGFRSVTVRDDSL